MSTEQTPATKEDHEMQMKDLEKLVSGPQYVLVNLLSFGAKELHFYCKTTSHTHKNSDLETPLPVMAFCWSPDPTLNLCCANSLAGDTDRFGLPVVPVPPLRTAPVVLN